MLLALLDTLIASAASAPGIQLEVRPLDATDRLLSTQAVAEMVGVSDRAVRKWCEQGRIVATQPGGSRGDWRIPASQFAASPEEMSTLRARAMRLSQKYGGPLDDYER